MNKLKRAIAGLLIVCLFHNAIAAFYLATLVIFFVPFPAFADAFLDKAAEGGLLGESLINGFTVPDVNRSTGKITLNNGAVAGETIEQNELFQEIQPGSMDEAAAAFGNASAQGTYVNNTVSNLNSQPTQHSYAYQTLMGANTAMPNLLHDPIWNQSDNVLSQQSPLINDMFNGCTKTTDWGKTACSIHIKDIKQCKKKLATEKCTVNRSVTHSPIIGFISGNGSVSPCGIGCTVISIGVNTDNQWRIGKRCQTFTITASFQIPRPDSIESVSLNFVRWDDKTRIFINDKLIYTGRNGWNGPCEQETSWTHSPGTNVTDHFKSLAPGSVVKIEQVVVVYDGGEGHARFVVRSKPGHGDFLEDFIDQPVGCRQRLFNAWPLDGTAPPFIQTTSLNDQASTEWWQCTDASNSKVVGPITITPENYSNYIGGQDILPDAPKSPPAPLCYSAETRRPGLISLECYTDYQGYQVCPEYNYDLEDNNTCEALSSCAYVKEECEKDENGNESIDPVTGACRDFVVTYDCGTNHDAQCDISNNGENTICDADIRCMGGECVSPKQESNEDFIKAATAIQTLNETQKQMSCDPNQGACQFFEGEGYTCRMADLSILGSVDCCNMPIQGSWIDYMMLAADSWYLADTSAQIYAFGLENANNGLTGAWSLVTNGTVFQTPVTGMTEIYNGVTDTFTSMYDSVVSMLGEKVGTDLSISAIKAQAVQWLGEWIASTFGETAASTLLSTTTTGTGTAVTTTYSMTGSLLSSVITAVGIIYAIYQIAKMVVQMVFACTEDEMKLQMYKDQKLCTASGEIGSYCSDKILGVCVARRQAYCCFSSPFARIFQQQARRQLNMNFGKPKEPSCEGLSLSQIGSLDFDKMNFGEWINMLKVSGIMAINDAKIEERYSPQFSTVGKLPGTNNYSVIDRLNKQTNETNVDEQRQYLIDNL